MIHHLAQLILPNSHLPEQNLACGGLMKIRSTQPRYSTTIAILYNHVDFKSEIDKIQKQSSLLGPVNEKLHTLLSLGLVDKWMQHVVANASNCDTVSKMVGSHSSGARFTRKKVVTKILARIVTKPNFDYVTCVNYSFSPLS